MKRIPKIIVVSVSGITFLFVLAISGLFLVIYCTGTLTSQIKRSPDRKHTAKLIRKEWIDLNFVVKVDGMRVFWSPDFCPQKKDFQEQLLWDQSGNIVVLEVAGERLFGYNAKTKSTLQPKDLLAVIIPHHDVRKLGYESKLPKELVTHSNNTEQSAKNNQ